MTNDDEERRCGAAGAGVGRRAGAGVTLCLVGREHRGRTHGPVLPACRERAALRADGRDMRVYENAARFTF